MSEKSLFGHFNRSDFFAVLPPGFFAFTAVYSCLAIDFGAQGPSPSLWSLLEALATQLQQRPMLLIFLLFACYLLGSAFRALPVNWA